MAGWVNQYKDGVKLVASPKKFLVFSSKFLVSTLCPKTKN